MKSAKHFAPNYRLTIKKIVAAYFDLHYTSVNIICTYSFCIFFVRCFLNSTLIIKKKATMNWSEMHSLTIINAEHVNLNKSSKQSVLKLTFNQLSINTSWLPFH